MKVFIAMSRDGLKKGSLHISEGILQTWPHFGLVKSNVLHIL